MDKNDPFLQTEYHIQEVRYSLPIKVSNLWLAEVVLHMLGEHSPVHHSQVGNPSKLLLEIWEK